MSGPADFIPNGSENVRLQYLIAADVFDVWRTDSFDDLHRTLRPSRTEAGDMKAALFSGVWVITGPNRCQHLRRLGAEETKSRSHEEPYLYRICNRLRVDRSERKPHVKVFMIGKAVMKITRGTGHRAPCWISL